MDSPRERDQTVERLLRQSLGTPQRGGVTDACLDAETLAAWTDGRPDRQCARSGAAARGGLRALSEHRRDAGANQLDRAAGRTGPRRRGAGSPGSSRSRPRRPPWRCGLPSPAIPARLRPSPAAHQSRRRRRPSPFAFRDRRRPPPPEPAQAPPAGRQAPESPAARANATGRRGPERKGAIEHAGSTGCGRKRGERRGRAAAISPKTRRSTRSSHRQHPRQRPPRLLQAAPSNQRERADSARSALRAAAVAAPEIVSPDPAVRWRILGTAVQHSSNGGSTWETIPIGVAAELTAGAHPRPPCAGWSAGTASCCSRRTAGRGVACHFRR